MSPCTWPSCWTAKPRSTLPELASYTVTVMSSSAFVAVIVGPIAPASRLITSTPRYVTELKPASVTVWACRSTVTAPAPLPLKFNVSEADGSPPSTSVPPKYGRGEDRLKASSPFSPRNCAELMPAVCSATVTRNRWSGSESGSGRWNSR